MDAGTNGGGHLDEGTIHAWLDDALDATTAARVEAHVAECAECSAAVAEARGLIAGASRVVRALDDEREVASTTPAWGRSSAPAASTPLWRMLHVTPARATIAATLLVALGLTLTLPRRGAHESIVADKAQLGAPRASVPRDSLLDSAIRRNVAEAQPPRAVEPNPHPAVTIPQRRTENSATIDTTAPLRVAEGRATEQRARVARAAVADQSATGSAVPIVTEPPTAAKAAVPLATADVGGALTMPAAKAAAPAVSRRVAAAPECYRVQSPAAGASWGDVHLPMVVELSPVVDDSGRGAARVRSAVAPAEFAMASWRRLAGDSLQLSLRRIGYAGRLVLAGDDSLQEGTMRSGMNGTQLEGVVVTAVPEPSEQPHTSKKATRRSKPVENAVSTRAESAATAAPAPPALPGTPISVSARRVSCR